MFWDAPSADTGSSTLLKGVLLRTGRCSQSTCRPHRRCGPLAVISAIPVTEKLQTEVTEKKNHKLMLDVTEKKTASLYKCLIFFFFPELSSYLENHDEVPALIYENKNWQKTFRKKNGNFCI